MSNPNPQPDSPWPANPPPIFWKTSPKSPDPLNPYNPVSKPIPEDPQLTLPSDTVPPHPMPKPHPSGPEPLRPFVGPEAYPTKPTPSLPPIPSYVPGAGHPRPYQPGGALSRPGDLPVSLAGHIILEAATLLRPTCQATWPSRFVLEIGTAFRSNSILCQNSILR